MLGITLRAGDTEAKTVAQKHELSLAPRAGKSSRGILESHPLPDTSQNSARGTGEEVTMVEKQSADPQRTHRY